MCDITHSNICVRWLIHMCVITDSHVWHDASIRLTWCIYLFDMTHSYVWHDSFICVTWHIYIFDMIYSYTSLDNLLGPRQWRCWQSWNDPSFIVLLTLVVISRSSYNSLQHTETRCNTCCCVMTTADDGNHLWVALQHTATNYSKLQHAATHCSNTLHHTWTHCNTL